MALKPLARTKKQKAAAARNKKRVLKVINKKPMVRVASAVARRYNKK